MQTIWIFPCCSLLASTTQNFYFHKDLCIGWRWTFQERQHREIPERLLQGIWRCVSGEAWLSNCTYFKSDCDFASYPLFCFFHMVCFWQFNISTHRRMMLQWGELLSLCLNYVLDPNFYCTVRKRILPPLNLAATAVCSPKNLGISHSC